MTNIKKLDAFSNSITNIKIVEQDSREVDAIIQELEQGLKDGHMNYDRNEIIQTEIMFMIKKIGM